MATASSCTWRAICSAVAVAACAWLALQADPAPDTTTKTPRVAFLGFDPRSQASNVAAFVARLRAHGWENGRSIVLDTRFADGRFERLPALAAELVALGPDVIVSAGPPAVRAVQQATKSIPTVVVIHDPLGSGFVQTLRNPGRNITGIAFQDQELSAKRLDLLRQMVPGLTKVAVIWNLEGGSSLGTVHELEAIARSAGIALLLQEIVRPSDLPAAVAAAKAWGAQGMLQLASFLIAMNAEPLIDAARHHRLPLICEHRKLVVEGCLASYSASLPAMYVRMADYVDRLLRGARVASLPIEQPREFEFVVNQKTADALGLRLSYSIRLQATELLAAAPPTCRGC